MTLLGNVYHLQFPLIHDDHGGHRYLVVQDDPAYSFVRVVYGTSEKTDERDSPHRNAVKWTVDPATGNGLDLSTHLLPAVLYSVPRVQIEDRRVLGSLLGRMDDFHAKFSDAVGYRSGVRGHSAEAQGSWRGLIVRLAPQLESPVGLVLTSHAYSKDERHQLVLPLQFLDPNEEPLEGVIALTGFERLAAKLGGKSETLFTQSSALASVRHFVGEVRKSHGVVIEPSQMETVEDAVLRHIRGR